MSLSLSKGGNLSLSKTDPTLVNVTVGLGWDARSTDGQPFDLDASAFILNSADKVRTDADFIFYNQLRSTDGSVQHMGDNLDGTGSNPNDEEIKIKLNLISADVNKIAITVTIHDAVQRRQNFGQVKNAFITIINTDTNAEVVRFDLTEDMSTETAMIFGELYRHNTEWKFKAVGQGYAGGLKALANNYGINI